MHVITHRARTASEVIPRSTTSRPPAKVPKGVLTTRVRGIVSRVCRLTELVERDHDTP